MSNLDDKESSYLGRAYKGLIFFAVLGMIAVLVGSAMISQVFASLFK